MPNKFSVSKTVGPDLRPKQLTAKIFNKDGYEVASGHYVSDIVLAAGVPGYATICIPTKELLRAGRMDQRPGVALARSGPASKIKLLCRVAVGYRDNGSWKCVLNGFLTYQAHMFKGDYINAVIMDDLYYLSKFTLFGKVIYDPELGQKYFVSNNNDFLVFNRHGHGDALDVGSQVLFAPGHRYGHGATSETDPSYDPDPGYATTKTRLFEISDCLKYITDWLYGDRPSLVQDFGLSTVSKKFMKIPKNFGQNIEEQRTPMDLRCEGMNAYEALKGLVQAAGPYDLACVPINEKQSELRVIDMSRRERSGVRLYTAAAVSNNIHNILGNASCIVDGFVKEDASNYYKSVANCGDSPVSELMASTNGDDSAKVAPFQLDFGWSDEVQTLAKLRQVALGNDQNSLPSVFKEFPEWLSHYTISTTRNPFKGTMWENKPQVGHARIRPTQVTSFNNNVSNPLGLAPLEVHVEYRMTDFEYEEYQESLLPEDPERPDLGPWRYAGKFSALALSPDGRTITIPGLRELQKTWVAEHINESDPENPYNDAGQYAGEHIQPREIRIQVAVESDHCMVVRVGAQDESAQKSIERIDDGAPEFTLQIRNAPMQYVLFLRTQWSRPVGWGGFTPTAVAFFGSKWQAKCTQGSELFTDELRLRRHANVHQKNFCRVLDEFHVELPGLFSCYQIGQQIQVETADPLKDVVGIAKCIHMSCRQFTKIECGAGSAMALWDGVIRAFESGSSGDFKAGQSKTSTTTSDYPQTPTTSGGDSPSSGGTSPSYPGPTNPTNSGTTSPSDNSSGGDVQAKGNQSDSGGVEALFNQRPPEDEMTIGPRKDGVDEEMTIGPRKDGGAPGDTGGAGAAGPAGGSNDGVKKDGESFADYNKRMDAAKSNMSGLFGNNGSGEGGGSKSGGGKGKIISGEALEQKDRDARNFGNTGETENSGRGKAEKGIYSGDSLRGLDDARERALYSEGGIKDRFRPGAGGAVTSGAPAQSASQEKRAKAAFNADVARGFNPNGSAPKANNNRGEPVKPTRTLEQAKRDYGRSHGVDYDSNKARIDAARKRWADRK